VTRAGAVGALRHKCWVPIDFGTPRSRGSEEFFLTPSPKDFPKTRLALERKSVYLLIGMKKFTSLLIALTPFLSANLYAASQPRGTLLELHSCELYAGGCIVSSEEPMDGRHMLQAWNFSGGNFDGVDFAGLKLAVLQASSANLAAENTAADRAVVYLPEKASAAQREALLAWLKATLPEMKNARLQTRTAPLQFAKTAVGYAFSAGDTINVKTDSLESCDKGGCGESLWYSPRTSSSAFTVAVNQSSRINEPLIELKWSDAGKRSIFLAKFGENERAKNVYVTSADLCGSTGSLF